MNTQIKSPSAIAAHTPGPWSADKLTNKGHNGAYYWHIQDAEGDAGNLVALVPSLYAGTTILETEEANARLIAAAPELLAALETLDHHFSDETDPRWISARAAIAKAKGGAL